MLKNCTAGHACVDRSCVPYRIVMNYSGIVGTQQDVYVLPEGKYQLSIVTPEGESKIIDTDATGHAVFILETAGAYSVSLVNGNAAAGVAVNAVNPVNQSSPGGTPPASLLQWLWLIAIIAILLIIAAYLLYRRSRKR